MASLLSFFSVLFSLSHSLTLSRRITLTRGREKKDRNYEEKWRQGIVFDLTVDVDVGLASWPAVLIFSKWIAWAVGSTRRDVFGRPVGWLVGWLVSCSMNHIWSWPAAHAFFLAPNRRYRKYPISVSIWCALASFPPSLLPSFSPTLLLSFFPSLHPHLLRSCSYSLSCSHRTTSRNKTITMTMTMSMTMTMTMTMTMREYDSGQNFSLPFLCQRNKTKRKKSSAWVGQTDRRMGKRENGQTKGQTKGQEKRVENWTEISIRRLRDGYSVEMLVRLGERKNEKKNK